MSEFATSPEDEPAATTELPGNPWWDAEPPSPSPSPWWEVPDAAPPTPQLQDDPAAAADRAAAAAQLRGQFDVVPDGYDGARDPNTLTESEYAQMVATYSDIRRGTSDIVLNTQAFHGTLGDQPEAEQAALDATMADFASMMQTEEGRAVVSRLANNTAGDEVDADGNPVHHKTTLQIANDKFATAAVAVPDSREGDRDPRATDGTGVDARIDNYHPGQTLAPPPGADDGWATQERSDVALFHELVHAVHQTEGSFLNQGVGADRLLNEGHGPPLALDEYTTVGLGGYATGVDGVAVSENLYRQARNQIRTGQREGDGEFEDRWRYYPS